MRGRRDLRGRVQRSHVAAGARRAARTGGRSSPPLVGLRTSRGDHHRQLHHRDVGTDGPDVLASLCSLCAKADVEIGVPDRQGSLCCGTSWSSKGLVDGYDRMAVLLRDAVDGMDPTGRLPVIADTSPCSEGLGKALSTSGRRVADAVAFVVQELVPRLLIDVRPPRMVAHPTCSSHQQDHCHALWQEQCSTSSSCRRRGAAVDSPAISACCTPS